GFGVSHDGGSTFTQGTIPVPSGGDTLGDGVVTTGPNGELYYATLADLPDTGGRFKSIIGVAKSTDNGASFSTPVDAGTTLENLTDLQDKEWVGVDRNASSPNKGNVYVTWTDFTSLNGSSNGSFIAFARSTNSGASFEAPIMLSPQDKLGVQGSVPVVAPNGDVYVAFADFHSSVRGIGLRKSTDGGKTFSPEVRAGGSFTG